MPTKWKMDKFVDTYNPTKLNQVAVENLDIPIASNKTESGIKNSQQTKDQDQTASQVSELY